MTDYEFLYIVKGICMEIHRRVGCGLLERAYSKILVAKLIEKGFKVSVEVPISINYDGIIIQDAYRADIIVNNRLIIELKAVENIEKVHYLQLGSYMQLGNFPLGLLVNFHSANLLEGIHVMKLDTLQKRYHK
ncbi:MAG: GxxExxY protein [Bacteroides sp.]|nr:GxxExxY protein [Bacteroidales bacterium]MBD5304658.1 GxxExxY protein [Bacteroides sp.]